MTCGYLVVCVCIYCVVLVGFNICNDAGVWVLGDLVGLVFWWGLRCFAGCLLCGCLLVIVCLCVFGCYLRCVVLGVDFTALVWIALLWVLLIVLAYSFVV